MSISSITDIFREKGKKIIDLLLRSENITVYEKLDGINFGFKCEDGNIEFFKKNGGNELDYIDRTLSSMYEKPIGYINKINKRIKENLDGYTVGFFYFPSEKTSYIKYDRIPKNSLVISYVEKPNGDKILNKEKLNEIADFLNVERPPIIFEGKFDNEQIKQIFDYIELTVEEKEDKFGDMGFSEYMFSIINPDYDSTTLNDTLKGKIESLIFRFENEDGDATYTKLVDPYFEEILKKNKPNKKSNDVYFLILSDIVDFLQFQNIDRIKLSANDFNSRYVELVCKLFNRLIEEKGKDYQDIVIELPAHLEKEFNNVNYDNVPNDKTKEYILVSLNYREIFRIFLASFRKKRRTRGGVFNTRTMNQMFNNQVDKILDKCVIDIDIEQLERMYNTEEITESFITFDDYQRIYIDGEDSVDVVGVNLDSYLRKVPDYIKDYTPTDFNMDNFASSIFVQTEPKEPTRDNRKTVNMLIDTFDPMTELVYEFAKFSYQKTKCPIVLVGVRPREEYYSDHIIKKVFESLCTEEYFEDYILLDRPNIKKVVYNFEEDYKFDKILANEAYMKFIEMQVISNYRDNNYLNLHDSEENVSEYYHTDRSIVARTRKAIEDYKFMDYKKVVPDAYYNLFNDIHKEYEFYNGKKHKDI